MENQTWLSLGQDIYILSQERMLKELPLFSPSWENFQSMPCCLQMVYMFLPWPGILPSTFFDGSHPFWWAWYLASFQFGFIFPWRLRIVFPCIYWTPVLWELGLMCPFIHWISFFGNCFNSYTIAINFTRVPAKILPQSIGYLFTSLFPWLCRALWLIWWNPISQVSLSFVGFWNSI